MSKISPAVTTLIETATSKALATYGVHQLNAVPVSMLKVNGDNIWLFDFFMKKTAENIQDKPEVALCCWTDMRGVQIKASMEYITEGPDFDEAVAWVAANNPSRVVKGLLVLSPTAIFDISPGGAFTEEELAV